MYPCRYLLPMGSSSIPSSAAVAKLLRQRRRALGLTLREVSDRTSGEGGRIPVSTLARIEAGHLDPGVVRLHALLRVYDISPHLAADLIELEELAVEPPEGRDLDTLHREGVDHFNAGRYAEGLAHFIAVQQYAVAGSGDELTRQRAMVAFGAAARDLGKIRLAKKIVDDLLCTPPDPSLLVNVLVLGASTWRALGSLDAAIAFLDRAEKLLDGTRPEKTAWVFHLKAKLLVAIGEPAAARVALDRAIGAYVEAGDGMGHAKALLTGVAVEEARDDLDAAAGCALEAMRIAARGGFRAAVHTAEIEVARVALRQGDAAAAIERLHDALAGFHRLGSRNGQFTAHYWLWKSHLAAGEKDRARFELKAARFLSDFIDEKGPERDEVRQAAGD